MDTDWRVVIRELLDETQVNLVKFFANVLPKIHKEWWKFIVVNQLSRLQKDQVDKQGITSLKELDMAALLKVFDKNWSEIEYEKSLLRDGRNYVREMVSIRNRSAHSGTEEYSSEDTFRDLDTIHRFCTIIKVDGLLDQKIREKKSIAAREFMGAGDLLVTSASPKFGRPNPATTSNSPRPISHANNPPVASGQIPDESHPVNLLADVKSWADYVAALFKADDYWRKATNGKFRVFGERESWVAVIQEVRDLAILDTWGEMTNLEGRMLMGRSGQYQLLGNMGSAFTGCSYFLTTSPDNLVMRDQIRISLQPLIHAQDAEFSSVAADVFAKIRRTKSIGSAIATRLMALARPDRAISVNDGSKEYLSLVSGQSKNTMTSLSSSGVAKNYQRLLDWWANQPWIIAPRPSDPHEQQIWDFRGALIDPFVYKRRQVKG